MDLLPCPFCGDVEPEIRYTSIEAPPIEYWVRCKNGCVEQTNLYEFEEAVKRWNIRV